MFNSYNSLLTVNYLHVVIARTQLPPPFIDGIKTCCLMALRPKITHVMEGGLYWQSLASVWTSVSSCSMFALFPRNIGASFPGHSLFTAASTRFFLINIHHRSLSSVAAIAVHGLHLQDSTATNLVKECAQSAHLRPSR